MRRQFKLPRSPFQFEEIEEYPTNAEHLAAFVRATIDQCASEIYIRPGILDLGSDAEVLDTEPAGDPLWPRFRIRPEWQPPALRQMLVEAFQTVGHRCIRLIFKRFGLSGCWSCATIASWAARRCARG